MTSERKFSSYRNGTWVWDDTINGLVFFKEMKDQQQTRYSCASTATATVQLSKDTRFKETVGNTSQMNFRRLLQRKVKLYDKDVVTLQDVKDVTIFTATASLLSLEFISYFHTKAMDDFLRALIVYFQYYFQIWTKLQARRSEVARSLRHRRAEILENEIRDDLSDLRAMVARNYSVLTLGIGDAAPFHHMSNRNNVSLSDKDRKIFETLVMMATRVVYIALNRKMVGLIEKELNRLLRTNTFNPIIHAANPPGFVATKQEERVLVGKACTRECKLFQRSPVTQEIVLDTHDYRMLAIGVADMGNYYERQNYLEIAFAAPEEYLEECSVPVGFLGVPRRYMDVMLKPKEIDTTRRASIMKPLPEFVIPKKQVFKDMKISETLPKVPCQFQESLSTSEVRKQQCKKWREYIKNDGKLPEIEEFSILSKGSHMTLFSKV